MAKQIGDIIIVGTIDDITFYEMEGKGYARHKSSLTGKRVKRDQRFKRTMQSAHRFAKGNQLASKVYRGLPREEQVYALFKGLKSMAVLALKEGKSEAEVLVLLQRHAIKESFPLPAPKESTIKSPVVCKSVPCTKNLFGGRGGRRKRGAPNLRITPAPAPVQRE